MKYFAAFSQIIILGFGVFAFSHIDRRKVLSADRSPANVIEGTIYDPGRRPIPDLWIELQNEFNLNLARIRSGPGGRFTFRGIGSGHYYIKVYTTGTNFEEQS